MAMLCEKVDSTTNQCMTWVEHSHSIVPDLSTADRDAMLLWMIGIFAVVFVVKQIQRLL